MDFSQVNSNRFLRKTLRQLKLAETKLSLFAQLPISTQRLYFAIVRTREISPTKTCFKSQVTLGRDTGTSRCTVNRGTKRLKGNNYLQTQWRGVKKTLVYIPLFVPDMVRLLTLLSIGMAAEIARFHLSATQTNNDISFILKQSMPQVHLDDIVEGVPRDIRELHHNKLKPGDFTKILDEVFVSPTHATCSKNDSEASSEHGMQYQRSDDMSSEMSELLARQHRAKMKYQEAGGAHAEALAYDAFLRMRDENKAMQERKKEMTSNEQKVSTDPLGEIAIR